MLAPCRAAVSDAAAAAGAPDAGAPAAEDDGPLVNGMTLDQRYALARSVGEECVTESELRELLRRKPNPVAYDGFEPSGRMHIAQVRAARARARAAAERLTQHRSAARQAASLLLLARPALMHACTRRPPRLAPPPSPSAQGVLKAINVNKLTKCGVTFKFWVADWFAQVVAAPGRQQRRAGAVSVSRARSQLCCSPRPRCDVASNNLPALPCPAPPRRTAPLSARPAEQQDGRRPQEDPDGRALHGGGAHAPHGHARADARTCHTRAVRAHERLRCMLPFMLPLLWLRLALAAVSTLMHEPAAANPAAPPRPHARAAPPGVEGGGHGPHARAVHQQQRGD